MSTTPGQVRRITRLLLLGVVGVASLAGARISAAEASRPPRVPRLAGPWIRLTDRPPLERWGTEKVEPVDFTIFRAADGRWQLISCIRHTSHPGKGRLLYRWSNEVLAAAGWRADGIFLESSAEIGNADGLMQAPHCVIDAGRYHLFYNSTDAHLMTSRDGITFTHHRTADDYTLFKMGRDVMLFDDRERHGRWIAYYTAVQPGLNPRTRDHTVKVRTAPALTGPWSAEEIDVGTPTEPPAGYLFAYAESPFVLERDGWYFRFEQMIVYASRDPLRWSGPAVANLIPRDPMRYLAPEIIVDGDREYVAAYGWRGNSPRGIFLAPLEWVPGGGR